MKSKISSSFLSFMAIICFCFSCSSDLDFKQTKNLKLIPTIVTNFGNFEEKATDFVKNGAEITQFSDTQPTKVFDDIILKKELKEVDLYFEITNTIARNYSINLIFYSKKSTILRIVKIEVPAYNGITNLITKTETFDSVTIHDLRLTDSVKFEITMLPGTVLTENSPGSLKLRSSLTAKFEVK
jgi:hypothetical protein